MRTNISTDIRNNWTINEITEIYNKPLIDLVFDSALIHRKYHNGSNIQISALLSIKTGGCTEDCKYCSQSVYYKTKVDEEEMMLKNDIIEKARQAKVQGASRFCLSTAWRQIPDEEMDGILDIISSVNQLGLEVCATMGMLTKNQAKLLKDAGLHTYNHNLDTGENYYNEIVSTRTYQDRLETLNIVQRAGLSVCSGGILGMGESQADRINMLYHLSTLSEHPGSVPVNVLVPVEGTKMKKDPDFSFWDLLRTISTARILMPKSYVRLSAGRSSLSDAEQALCFFAGANSVFAGEKLLTTPNVENDRDEKLFQLLGLNKEISHSG